MKCNCLISVDSAFGSSRNVGFGGRRSLPCRLNGRRGRSTERKGRVGETQPPLNDCDTHGQVFCHDGEHFGLVAGVKVSVRHFTRRSASIDHRGERRKGNEIDPAPSLCGRLAVGKEDQDWKQYAGFWKKCAAIECLDRYLFLFSPPFGMPNRTIYDDGVRVRTKIVSPLLLVE